MDFPRHAHPHRQIQVFRQRPPIAIELPLNHSIYSSRPDGSNTASAWFTGGDYHRNRFSTAITSEYEKDRIYAVPTAKYKDHLFSLSKENLNKEKSLKDTDGDFLVHFEIDGPSDICQLEPVTGNLHPRRPRFRSIGHNTVGPPVPFQNVRNLIVGPGKRR